MKTNQEATELSRKKLSSLTKNNLGEDQMSLVEGWAGAFLPECML